jgi:hypothetical protein
MQSSHDTASRELSDEGQLSLLQLAADDGACATR